MLFPYALWCMRAWPVWAPIVLSALGTSSKDECDGSNDASEHWVTVDAGNPLNRVRPQEMLYDTKKFGPQ